MFPTSKTDLRLFLTLLISAALAGHAWGQGPTFPRGGGEPFDLQQRINAAIASGAEEVRLPAGRLLLTKTPVVIKDVEGLSIRGAGKDRTVLINSKFNAVIQFDNARNVALRDFAIDYDPLPFTQGTIARIDRQGPKTTIHFNVHRGYPDLPAKKRDRLMLLFNERDTRHRILTHTSARRIERMSPRRGRITLSARWAQDLKEGDFVVVTRRHAHGIAAEFSGGLVFERVAIHAAPLRGINSWYTREGLNIIRDCSIVPGPPPEGAREPRLHSVNKDGIDFYWGPGSVLIENYEVRLTPDDGIHIYGPSNWKVIEVESDTAVRVIARMPDHFTNVQKQGYIKQGSKMSAVRSYDATRLFDDQPIKSLTVTGDIEQASLPPRLQHVKPFARKRQHIEVARVVFQEPVAGRLSPGDLLLPQDSYPREFIVRDSRFYDIRGRGVLSGGSNGVIENCRFERTSMAAVELFNGNLPLNLHAGSWNDNVTIRNNEVIDCLFDPERSYASSRKPGAIHVGGAWLLHKEVPGAWVFPGHRNIEITGNTIDGSGNAGIFVTFADGVTIADNTIRNTHRLGGEIVGRDAGLKSDYAITVMNSRDVTIEGNEFGPLGRHASGQARDYGELLTNKANSYAEQFDEVFK